MNQMAYEQRDNSGSLFKNDKKESDNHPDYNGSAMVNGTEMWMSAWLKTSSNGKKFMSFSFKPKEAAKPVAKSAPVKQAEPDFDDDMPF
jgi:uncharacterized protein (DUF736 family)